jgi:translation initiation factor eIF-2B subunit gamma
VQGAITGDFIVLPCDLVSELGGDALVESWMIQSAGLGGVASASEHASGDDRGYGGVRSGRRGGLGVWYETKGIETIKGQETDFVATTPSTASHSPAPGSLLPRISNLVYAMPTDTLNDITEAKKSFPIRHSLLRKHAHVKMLTTHRDAHIYFFPHWVLEMARRNERFDSISEDIVGWWAKARWQDGLGDKLGLRAIFDGTEDLKGEESMMQSVLLEEEIDLPTMSSTWTSDSPRAPLKTNQSPTFASRVVDLDSPKKSTPLISSSRKLTIPPIHAYIHPSDRDAPLVRRCDTTSLLLTISLQLARLPSLDAPDAPRTPHPFSHKSKIAHRSGVAQRSTVTQADCLLAENVEVEEKCVVKESVIGSGCKIEKGARLTRCVLMDDVVVGERAQLSGCVVGRRSVIGKEATLRDCEVQEGYAVPEKSDAKNEKFMIFEGLEDDDGDDCGQAFDDSKDAPGIEL